MERERARECAHTGTEGVTLCCGGIYVWILRDGEREREREGERERARARAGTEAEKKKIRTKHP
jgi:hypothetical protein